ncbi:MAG: SMP-30/gluconolactonase/LRE family protein [Flavisolibacter sp.]
MKLFLPFLFLLFISCTETKQKTIGSIERLDAELDKLISKDAAMEIIAEGHEWTEGPLWISKHNMLLYSDIPRNTIYKWTEAKGAEVYLTPSGYTGAAQRGGETGSNAILLTTDGKLLLCQHGDRRLAIMDAPLDKPAAKFTTLVDNYAGKKLNSPNDAVISKDGDIYFTDPPYGLEKNMEDPLKELPFQGVYKLKKDGKVVLLTDSITRPNGIGLTPDGKKLVIANSDGKKPIWYEYEIAGDSIKNGRVLYERKTEKGGADGLKITKSGYLFATGPGGLFIFNPQNKLIGKLKLPEATSNCAFSEDEKTLYLTVDMYVVRLKMQ